MSTVVVDIDSIHRERADTVAPALGSRSSAVPRTARVRLTRRGRFVVLLALLASAFGVLTFLGAPAASTDQTRHAPAHTVVVEPGETLWEIATSVAPGEDPRQVIAQIIDLNSLPDAGSIRVGQPLYVPAR